MYDEHRSRGVDVFERKLNWGRLCSTGKYDNRSPQRWSRNEWEW